MKRLLALLLTIAMLCCGVAFAEEAAAEHSPVVILYTNDVHCGIEDDIGYAGLAAYRKAFEAKGYETLLVDNGDSIQGGPIGTLSKGEYIIDIMNEIGYDVATLGNHEFDYGMDQLNALMEKASFPYVSANFADMEGNTILDPYVIKEAGGWKIAFIGATTPKTYTSSNPKNFQDEEGNYIYNFSAGNDGADLYAAIQNAVDAARGEGADAVILMSHLGIEADCQPYTSNDVIMNTTGIDVVLDGHSHSVIECEKVLNAAGEEVTLTSTGTKLANLGALTLEAGEEGISFTTALHNEDLFQDAEFSAYIQDVKAKYEAVLNEVVATTAVDLTVNDPVATTEDGKPVRIVRSQETNLGDLCADAYRATLGSDIAFVNGGGVRANIPAGDITYGQILNVHPFGNMACMIEIKGEYILDALEMSARAIPGETGGFLQTSGLTYEINSAIESPVVIDEAGNFAGVEGERRVSNVMVGGEPLDPEKTYTVASHNFMLKDGGDGYVMFKNGTLLVDQVKIDNQLLIDYIVETLGGVVGEEYADPYGQGRIVIK